MSYNERRSTNFVNAENVRNVKMAKKIYQKKKSIEKLSNMFALLAVIDSVITFPLVVYLLRKGQLTELAAMSSCIQIMCFFLLSIISACLLLQTRQRYADRLDAIGAWLVIHVFNMVSNLSIVLFELYPSPSNLWTISIPLTALLSWKGFFISIEIVGLPYSLYVIRRTVQCASCIMTHPLFSELGYESISGETPNNNNNNNNRENNNVSSRTVENMEQQIMFSSDERVSSPDIYESLREHPLRHYDSYLSLSRQYLPYDGSVGPVPFNQKYQKVLPNIPSVGNFNLVTRTSNSIDNYGFEGDNGSPSTIGTSI